MKQRPETQIDLKKLFFKFVAKWYYFLAALILCVGIAYIYNKIQNPVYAVNATILLENENAGQRGTSELLGVVETQKKVIEVEDQIGLITSFDMIEKAIERLDYGVSYYIVPDAWINTFGDLKVEERISDNYPFKIVLNPEANQLLNTPIYIRILSKNKFQLSVEGGQTTKLYNISTNKTSAEIESPEINKIVTINEPFQDKHLNFKLFLNEGHEEYTGKKFYFEVNNKNNLTKNYQKRLKAKAISRESRIIDLQLESPVVDKDMKFLDTLVSVFTETDLIEKRQTSIKTIEYIQTQLADVSKQLATAENDLTSYRSNRQTDVTVDRMNVYDKIDQFNAEKQQIASRIRTYTDVLNYMERNQDVATNAVPATSGIDSPVIITQVNELANLYQQKQKLLLTLKPDHPSIQPVETEIVSRRRSIISNLREGLAARRQDLRSVEQRIGALYGNINRIPENESQLRNLQQRYEYNDQTRNYLQEKLAEAQILLATNTASKRPVDKAKVGEKTAPKTNAIFLIAILAGLCLPAIGITVADMFDDTIKTKEEVKNATNIPILGMIGHSDGKNAILARTDNYKSSVSESFRSLRVNLQYLVAGTEHKTIGITSSASGEGKTFCAINLSTVLALSGKKTILIDTDLRKPKVASYLGMKNMAGLSSYLIRNSKLDEIVQPTKIKNFDVITSGPTPPNPVELVELDEMRELIMRLKLEYDYIIIDTPPISYVAEYMVLKEYMDANIFVIRANYTRKPVLEMVNELYESKTLHNLSIVLNDINFSEMYGFDYRSKTRGYYQKA
ncbi:polysaccharide biosynthesis tyrosine autokinase [Rhodocytophaga aerolata]|uniref:non-specific protein-tyrosine kinase n=1 Tax=Rhodocytophaga aerolata TaxID=455078 RepID=A0ABT8RBE3_9BACT|nr:polysaccharide biosynthesis tyrosine autokinase [Rhodocytophaga aerolata]MDO1448629.1 polysaccharide biosynthesis tyrosine autokinase [Rhodocytophaga aerolata]